jgi:membrane associated rhomboid family serine protease
MGLQQRPTEVIHRSHTRRECVALALVLEAADIRYEISEGAGDFTLVVAAPDAVRARAELDAYARENRDGSAPVVTTPHRGSGWGGALGYAAVLTLVGVLQHQNTFGFDWLAAGRTHAGLIRQGEWWRAVTALSLHVDLPHLAANMAIGGLIGLFAGQLLGSGLAWASILFAGTMGNLFNAWTRQPNHTSVGASTAVFAALGIVAAHAWKRRRRTDESRLARWAPLVAGVVLLGYLGTGGARTDVAAHVAGFLSGVGLGVFYGMLGDRVMFTARIQVLLGVCTVVALALGWSLALAR